MHTQGMSPPRVVSGLQWAALSTESPKFLRESKKGSKARGLAYEKKVKKWLERRSSSFPRESEFFFGQWLAFVDDGGSGLAQPDIYILLPGGWILLIEIKLTQTDYAEAQLEKLYKPLLEHIYRPAGICCVQICKNLRYDAPHKIEDLSQLVDSPRAGTFLLHHLD